MESVKLIEKWEVDDELLQGQIAEFIQKLRKYLGCETCTSSIKPKTCKSCSDLYLIIEEYEEKAIALTKSKKGDEKPKHYEDMVINDNLIEIGEKKYPCSRGIDGSIIIDLKKYRKNDKRGDK